MNGMVRLKGSDARRKVPQHTGLLGLNCFISNVSLGSFRLRQVYAWQMVR